MQVIECKIPGLKIIQPDLHHDHRGFLSERFHAKEYAQAGLPHHFVQDNIVHSAPGVLRGVHYQYAPPQGKLVSAVGGRVWDVAVDLRPSSPTFGQHHAVELSADNGLLFWVPAGFAHGFCVLGDEPATLYYKVDAHYDRDGENGIRFNDPDLNIPWPIKNPVTSERDRAQQSWRDYVKNTIAWDSL